MSGEYKEEQQQEVDHNFEIFQKKLENNEIASDLFGKFALMKNGKIIDYFNTSEDANKAGNIAYDDKLFSIQEVSAKIVNLGYYSYAVV